MPNKVQNLQGRILIGRWIHTVRNLFHISSWEQYRMCVYFVKSHGSGMTVDEKRKVEGKD